MTDSADNCLDRCDSFRCLGDRAMFALQKQVAELQEFVLQLAERVYNQSDLLSRAAERQALSRRMTMPENLAEVGVEW